MPRLHSGAPFWLVRNGLAHIGDTGPLPRGVVDVVVAGAGITGALVADALSAAGLDVVVLDRRLPASGSTAASTALVSYEIDVDLHRLIERVGEDAAVAAYRVSAAAVDRLAATAASLEEPCGFARRPSLYLATRPRDRARLEREVVTRERYGLNAQFWTPQRVRREYGFASFGALRTEVGAVVDPVRLTCALLRRAMTRGARVIARTTVQRTRGAGETVVVTTDRGRVETRWIVYALGYEMPARLRPDMVALHSTYALATEPVTDFGPWRDRCLIWETARPYFYLCTTDDGRILIGGADAPFRDPSRRDRLMPTRAGRLERRLAELFPDIGAETAFTWAGTFGVTRDGLPFIGPRPGHPRELYALGYGANGITFGAVAADILRDICTGTVNDAAQLFRLDRDV